MGSAISRGQKCPGGQDLPDSPSMGVVGTVPPVQETLENVGQTKGPQSRGVTEEHAATGSGWTLSMGLGAVPSLFFLESWHDLTSTCLQVALRPHRPVRVAPS